MHTFRKHRRVMPPLVAGDDIQLGARDKGDRVVAGRVGAAQVVRDREDVEIFFFGVDGGRGFEDVVDVVDGEGGWGGVVGELIGHGG